jgi:hypothetical protein
MSNAMSDGSIGIQQILPRTGTAWENQNPVPPPQDNAAADSHAAPAPPPDRGPTPDGVGQIIDKLV